MDRGDRYGVDGRMQAGWGQQGTHEQFDPFPELCFSTPCLDSIDGDPITSPNKDPLVVDPEVK